MANALPVVRTRTLLSIDRYAQIMGINPMFFNQGSQINTASGVTIMPFGSGSPNVDLTWQQESWSLTNNVSREQLAQEIRTAEHDAASFLGFYPAPDWTEEIIDMPRHHDPLVGFTGIDVRGNPSSVKLSRSKFIDGGVRAVAKIGDYNISYVDNDNDLWAETAVIEIPLAEIGDTDINEIKAYLPNGNGHPTFEVRPARQKYKTDTNLVMHFWTWQLIDPEEKHKLPNNDMNSVAIDLSSNDYLLHNIEVYREYNDNSQMHYTFIMEDGSIGDSGKLILKNIKADYVTPVPVDKCCDCSGQAAFVKVLYYSGNKCKDADNTYYDNLDPVLAKAIAYIATARLERPIAGNVKNVTSFTQLLQNDMSSAGGDNKTYRMFHDIIYENPFGTRYGELLGYKMLIQFDRKL